MERVIGVISDTHGLLRPEAARKLQGCSLIIHAGDIGEIAVLEQLQQIAPVIAVRGNTDKGPWALRLKQTEYVAYEGRRFFVLHDISQLALDPKAAGVEAVIFGHSHEPSATMKDGILFLNPGSAGPRRFSLPVSMAYLRITEKGLLPQFFELK